MTYAAIEEWMVDHLDGLQQRENVLEAEVDDYMFWLGSDELKLVNRATAFRQTVVVPLEHTCITGRRLEIKTDSIQIVLEADS